VSKLQKFLYYWLPVLLWMAVAFTASSDPNSARHSSMFFEPFMRWLFPHLSADTIGGLHHLFRKSCHLMEYFILALLTWRAIHQPRPDQRRPWRWDEAGLTIAIVFTYAASDEFHQVFVPGRTALVTDVLIDTSGGLLGLPLLWLARKLVKIW
jgi:VanZ family protein